MNRVSAVYGVGDEIASFAREELKRYLASAKDALLLPAVVVDSECAQKAFPEEFARLLPDGFVIGRHEGVVVIGAVNDRGLLYGVYEYVEKALGIRMVDAPFGEVDTGVRDAAWPAAVVTENPSFSYRGGCMHHSRTDEEFLYNIDRLGKFRLNQVLLFPHQLSQMKKHIGAYRKRGIRVTMGGHCWTDLFYRGITETREEFLQSHPAWHALADGKRLICADGAGQFCLSNREATDHFVKNALALVDEYSDCIDVLSLWPNDTYSLFCECEECAKHRKSDLVLRLCNRVAEGVAEKYPYMQIEMLAYNDFTAPPTETVPAPNVLVNFAAIHRDYRIPFYSAERRNIAFYHDLKGWRALRPDLETIVYEYYRLDSTPKSSVIQYEFERFREERLIGVMEDTFQINNPDGVQGVIGFMAYLEYRLMWNIDQSADAMLREVIDVLFGGSAPVVWRMMRRMEQIQSGFMFYDLLWHEWRLRPRQSVETQDVRLTFVMEELEDIRQRLAAEIADTDGIVRERLEKLLASLQIHINQMGSIANQVRAMLLIMDDASAAEIHACLDKALAYRGVAASTLPDDRIGEYCRAYSDLPADIVRKLIPIDRKDRVSRVEIMHLCERICETEKNAGGCMGCTTPVCIQAVHATPRREHI